MAKWPTNLPKSSPAERRNWGYWDGRSDRERGKTALWSKGGTIHAHPYDKPYGEAYWSGFYGEPHPNTGETPDD